MSEITRLTQSDLKAIETRIEMEVGAMEVPTMETLLNEGYRESRAQVMIDWIESTGNVITRFIAEGIQSLAALIICVVFAVLEYQRVYHGSSALGQDAMQSGLIAFAVVTANVVHPIYALRALKGVENHTITEHTLRGAMGATWRRLWGKPLVREADWSHNPVLHFAAVVITWTTVVLAVYDLLNPLIHQIFDPDYAGVIQPVPILVLQIVMGLGLSVAGVFFLQAASHEIGVRTLQERPKPLQAILLERRAEYEARKAEIREKVTQEHMAGKIADSQRKQANSVPFGSTAPDLDRVDHANGHLNKSVNGFGGSGIEAQN